MLKDINEDVGSVALLNPFCAFYLSRKQRTCKMRVKKGAMYCAEHLTADPAATTTSESSCGDKRIPCPLDPAHTVYESRLKAHLKKCNASVSEIIPSYFSKDVNVLVGNEVEEESSCELSKPSISELVDRILRVADELKVDEIRERFKSENDSLKIISETEKHRIQQKALGDLILEKVKPGNFEKVVIVEFGAGKGGLSSYLWESFLFPNKIPSEFILVDRSNFRLKKDAKMRHAGAIVKRLFIDIKDLNLDDLMKGFDRETTYFFWISKHLCGTATCLTINSLKTISSDINNLKGTFCVALCCHQCCSSKTYPNMSFLNEIGLIKAQEPADKVFRMLCSITSWAVCGFREAQDSEDNSDNSDDNSEDEVALDNGDTKRIKVEEKVSELAEEEVIFTTEKKEIVGRIMKRIFDFGRKIQLNSNLGIFSKLKHYVEEEVTLENAVIFGHLD